MIKITCKCGASLQAKQEAAGKQLNCPTCGQAIKIPDVQTSQRIPVACDCGKAFQVKLELAGKQVKCPSCEMLLTIPAVQSAITGDPNQLAEEPASTTDPLDVGSVSPLGNLGASNDPLGLGNVEDPFGDAMPLAPAATYAGALPNPTTAPPTKRSNQREKRPFNKRLLLEIVTGVFCFLHGGTTILMTILVLFSMMTATEGGFGFFGLVALLILLGYFAMSVAILVGGIGVMMRKPWGTQIGAPAAYVYFCLLGIGLVLTLVSMLGSGFGLMMTLLGLPVTIVESIGPGLLIYLKDDDDCYDY